MSVKVNLPLSSVVVPTEISSPFVNNKTEQPDNTLSVSSVISPFSENVCAYTIEPNNVRNIEIDIFFIKSHIIPIFF